jgi:hypothetical protein
VAALLAIAVFGIVMNLVFDSRLERYLATSGMAPAAAQQVHAQRAKLAAIEAPAGLTPPQRGALKGAVGGAYVAGFRWVMWLSALLALGSALSAWWLIGGSGAGPVRQDPSPGRAGGL